MIRFLAPAALIPLPALADVPRVMTDIAPIHSLTAQVMGELGTPDLLLPPGADPHDFALRPSDAEALDNADLVIWVGEALTPWLEDPLETLAPDATKIALLETDGWNVLEFRDLEMIGAKGDDHDHDHDHGDHDHDHDHGEEHAHDDHDHDHGHDDHGHDHDHDHGAFDPHAWADPAVAKVWVASIAEALSVIDPENAATYAANAAAASARLDTLDTELAAKLAPLAQVNYILPHDGYQYFEARYGLTASGAHATSNAETPGPAQVAALREMMADQNIACVFSDTSIPERWAAIVVEGTAANTAPLDVVGLGLEAGPDLYAAMIMRLGDSFTACLGQ
jgi:zinc transport system substrate-binding protein